MPVIKIFYDETLDRKVRENQSAIQSGLEQMMREILAADPAKCQVVLASAAFVTPLPVYVDMQFRANNFRKAEVVAAAMDHIVSVLGTALDAGIRIRAFGIDQATLYARDAKNAGN